jgi:hypothetical protein
MEEQVEVLLMLMVEVGVLEVEDIILGMEETEQVEEEQRLLGELLVVGMVEKEELVELVVGMEDRVELVELQEIMVDMVDMVGLDIQTEVLEEMQELVQLGLLQE